MSEGSLEGAGRLVVRKKFCAVGLVQRLGSKKYI